MEDKEAKTILDNLYNALFQARVSLGYFIQQKEVKPNSSHD